MCAATTTRGETHHVHHDGDGRLTGRLAAAVAARTAAAPPALPPLDARINVSALDDLWNVEASDRPTGGCLTFTYGGYVVVRSTGAVLLREATAET